MPLASRNYSSAPIGDASKTCRAIDLFVHVMRLLPPDLPHWQRNDGNAPDAPFTAFAGGKPDRYSPEMIHQGWMRRGQYTIGAYPANPAPT